jgi:hypothetical protein
MYYYLTKRLRFVEQTQVVFDVNHSFSSEARFNENADMKMFVSFAIDPLVHHT